MDSNTRTVCEAKTRSPEFLLVLHHSDARRLTCEPKIINRRHREPQLCDDLPETKNEQQRGERTDA